MVRTAAIRWPAPAFGTKTLELHIRHMAGGVFTDQLFSSVKERDILRLEGPHGTFYLNEQSAHR